eukprot:361939-Chlamydomonas_euryale.AAC.7
MAPCMHAAPSTHTTPCMHACIRRRFEAPLCCTAAPAAPSLALSHCPSPFGAPRAVALQPRETPPVARITGKGARVQAARDICRDAGARGPRTRTCVRLQRRFRDEDALPAHALTTGPGEACRGRPPVAGRRGVRALRPRLP